MDKLSEKFNLFFNDNDILPKEISPQSNN